MPDESREEQIERRIDREVAGAVALASHPSGAVTIAPKNLAEMFEFAKLMSLSGICVRPMFRGQRGACFAIVQQAFKWGADPFAVANKAYAVRNKAGEETIAYEAQLIHAIVNTRAPLKQRLRASYTGEGVKRACKVVGWLQGEDEPFEYQSPRIEQIAVKNSPLWTADPDQQLFYYSTRAWARRTVPEILLGIYTPEEAQGQIIDVDATEIERPRREDFASNESAKSYKASEEHEPPGEEEEDEEEAEDEEEPEPEAAEEPFLVVDAHGEEHQVDGPMNAAEAFRAALAEAGKIRQDLGIAAVWESNTALIFDLRERSHDDLADELGRFYSEALAAADAPPQGLSQEASSPPTPTTPPPPKKAPRRPPQRPATAAATPAATSAASSPSELQRSRGPSATGEPEPIVPIKPKPLGGASRSGWNWPGFVDDVLAQARAYPPSRTAEVRAKNRAMIDALHDFSQKMRTTDFARLEQGLAAIQREAAVDR
jgi:hypothetical protein